MRAPPARGTGGGSPTPGGCFRETSRVGCLHFFVRGCTHHQTQTRGFWHAPASTLQPRATARIGSTTETTYARNAIAIGPRRAEWLQNRLAAHWPTHARRGCSRARRDAAVVAPRELCCSSNHCTNATRATRYERDDARTAAERTCRRASVSASSWTRRPSPSERGPCRRSARPSVFSEPCRRSREWHGRVATSFHTPIGSREVEI